MRCCHALLWQRSLVVNFACAQIIHLKLDHGANETISEEPTTAGESALQEEPSILEEPIVPQEPNFPQQPTILQESSILQVPTVPQELPILQEPTMPIATTVNVPQTSTNSTVAIPEMLSDNTSSSTLEATSTTVVTPAADTVVGKPADMHASSSEAELKAYWQESQSGAVAAG